MPIGLRLLADAMEVPTDFSKVAGCSRDLGEFGFSFAVYRETGLLGEIDVLRCSTYFL